MYRVFLHDPKAPPGEPGGALFIPPQGAGRIDNPAHYDVLYASDSPAGACAEVFYRGLYRQVWDARMLSLARFPQMKRALAWFELRDDAQLCNLDDPQQLLEHGLRPSEVIARDYARTRTWALRIFARSAWSGISWWSYTDARWSSTGVWDRTAVCAFGVEPLSLAHPALQEAAAVLSVQIRA